MSLTKCPQCGQRRFDPVAGSCERRQCGYVDPAIWVDPAIEQDAMREMGDERDPEDVP